MGCGTIRVRTYEEICVSPERVVAAGEATCCTVPLSRWQDFMQNAIGGVVTRAAKDPQSAPGNSQGMQGKHCSEAHAGPRNVGD